MARAGWPASVTPTDSGAPGEGWPPDVAAGNTLASLGPQGAAGSGSSMKGWRQGWSRKDSKERRREWEAGVSQQLRTRVVENHSQQFPMQKAASPRRDQSCPLPTTARPAHRPPGGRSSAK